MMKTTSKILLLFIALFICFSCKTDKEFSNDFENNTECNSQEYASEKQDCDLLNSDSDSSHEAIYASENENDLIADASVNLKPEEQSISKINDFKVDPLSEIISKRDRTSKHYLRKDGKTIDAILSPRSVHFKNENGEWEDINTDLVPVEMSDYSFANTKNNLKSWFPKDLTKNGVIIKTDEVNFLMGKNFTLSWVNANGTIIKSENFKSSSPKIIGNTVTYNNVYPNLKNEYIIQEDEIKHNYVFDVKPEIPEGTDYLFFGEDVELPQGYKIEFDQNNSGLVVINNKNEIYLEIPAPEVYEEDHKVITNDGSYASFELVKPNGKENKYTIITKVSAQWLSERKYPLTIDPTITLNGGSAGYIWYDYNQTYISGCSNYNTTQTYNATNGLPARIALNRNYSQYLGNCAYWCGYDGCWSCGYHCHYRSRYNTYRDLYKGWIKYNTSSIPDISTISAVAFGGNVSGGYSGDLYTRIYSSNGQGGYSTSSSSAQYNDITYYYHAATTYGSSGQYPYLALNSTAISRLQALLPNNYFQIGLWSSNATSGSAQQKYFNTGQSTLRVTYQNPCTPITQEATNPFPSNNASNVCFDGGGTVTALGWTDVPEATLYDVYFGTSATPPLFQSNLSTTYTTQNLNLQANTTYYWRVVPKNDCSTFANVTTWSFSTASTPCADDYCDVTYTNVNPITKVTFSTIDNTSSASTSSPSHENFTPFSTTTVEGSSHTLTIEANSGVTGTTEERTLFITAFFDWNQNGVLNDTGEVYQIGTIYNSNGVDGVNTSSTITIPLDNLVTIGNTTMRIMASRYNYNTNPCEPIQDATNASYGQTEDYTVNVCELPIAICKDITVSLDDNGSASISASDIDDGSTANCGLQSITISQSNFDCSHVGQQTVDLTITDVFGNSATCQAFVQVIDTSAPTLSGIPNDVTVECDALPTDSPTASDNCGNPTITLNEYQQFCQFSDAYFAGAGDWTDLAGDGFGEYIRYNDNNTGNGGSFIGSSGQIDSNGSAFGLWANSGETSNIVRFFDTTMSSGDSFSIDMDNGSIDNGGTVGFALQNASAGNLLEFYFVGGQSNYYLNALGGPIDTGIGFTSQGLSLHITLVSATSAVVEITELNGGNVYTFTLELLSSGDQTISKIRMFNANAGSGSSNNAFFNNIEHCVESSTPTEGTCTNNYKLTKIWTSIDIGNNSSSGVQIVSVQDTMAPSISCPSDIDVTTDSGVCGANVTYTVSATDNCGSITIEQTSGLASGEIFPVGTTTNSFIVTDECGNTNTCSFDVTVTDNEAPTAVCQDITVQLDANGEASIVPADIDGQTSINSLNSSLGTESDWGIIGTATVNGWASDINMYETSNNEYALYIDLTVGEIKFRFADAWTTNYGGANGSLQLSGANINVASADTYLVTMNLNTLTYSLTPYSGNLGAGSNDACGIANLSLDITEFTCTDIGNNTVTLTVTDVNNNVSTCTAIVTVEDNIDPTAVCNPIDVELDATGNYTLSQADIDAMGAGSSDACGIASIEADTTVFSCNNVGPNNVTITVTDTNGNTATCVTVVNVEDNTAPNAVCATGIVVQLDANGNGSLTAAQVDGGSTDNCAIDSISIDKESFDCSDVAAGPTNSNDLFFSEYIEGSGNNKCLEIYNGTGAPVDLAAGGYQVLFYYNGSSSAGATVNLSGTIADGDVFVLCDNDSDGAFLAVADQTSTNGYYNGDDSLELVKSGTTLDIFGNIGTDPGSQWIVGSNRTQNRTLVRNSNITDGNTSNAAGFPSLGTEWTELPEDTVSNLGSHSVSGGASPTVTLTVTDVNGNSSTCTTTVTVEDNIDPIAVCNPIDVELDATGNYTLSQADIDAMGAGSSDACGIASIEADTTVFSCNNVGPNNVTITVTDTNGNTATCVAVVNVEDNTAPNAVCATGIVVQLDANGNGSLTAAQVDGGSTDNCAIDSISIDKESFDCNDIAGGSANPPITESFEDWVDGSYGGIATATLASGMWESNNAFVGSYAYTGTRGVRFNDDSGENEYLLYKGLDGNGKDGGLGTISFWYRHWDGDGSNVEFQVQYNQAGNGWTNIGSVVNAPSTTWMQFSESPNITGDDILVRVISIDDAERLSLDDFSMSDASNGPTVTLTVTDVNGNSSTCTTPVTVEDNIDPITVCNPIDVELDATGNYTLSQADIDAMGAGSSDACGIASIEADTTVFSCNNVGPNNVTITVTDTNGNTATCVTVVNVEDNTAPNAVCATGIVVQLDANGNGSLTAAQVDGGSTDNCAIDSISIDKESFDCSDLESGSSNSNDLFISEYIEGSSVNKCIEIYNGTGVPVDLNAGNYQLLFYFNGSTSAGTTLNLNGVIAPGDVYVVCDDGAAAAFQSQADLLPGNSFYNGDDAVVLSKNGSPIDIFGSIGQDPGSQWIQGSNGTANQTLVRNSNITDGNTSNTAGFPSLGTEWTSYPQDTSSYLGSHTVDSGSAVIVPVTLTVTDVNGNSSTCVANVAVEDNVNPNAVCQDITIALDENGNATIEASDIDGGSTDACGIANLSASQTAFDCSHIGINTVTLTVLDNNGNSSTCDALVNVIDNQAPNAICQDITIQLDANGNASINAEDVDGGSYDACTDISLSINKDTFDCNDIVEPANSNDLFFSEYVEGSSFNKYIEIYNGTGSSVNLANYQIRIYFNGNTSFSSNNLVGTLTDGDVAVFQNQNATVYSGSATSLTVVNWNGDDTIVLWNNSTNQAVDIFGSIGEDPGAEWNVSGNETQDRTLRRKASIINGNTDNVVGFPSLGTEWIELPQNDVSDLGSHTVVGGIPVTLTVTDLYGNTSSCTALVTVEDNIAPNAICQDITIQLDENGNATIEATDIDGGSTDACGVANIAASQTVFDCSQLGDNTVTLTVTDVNGNTSTCDAIVTVEDNIAPVVDCFSITVTLDPNGDGQVDVANFIANNNSSDNCEIASVVLSETSFDCTDIGGDLNELIISEYVDGTGNNDWIEIFNRTGNTVVLGEVVNGNFVSYYAIEIYTDGSSTPTTIGLLGSIADDETYTIAHSDANNIPGNPNYNFGSPLMVFDGNDAIALANEGVAVDIVGVIGNNPGTGWTSGANSTNGTTLVRNIDVQQGNVTNFVAALATEWTQYVENTTSFLGDHDIEINTGSNNVILTVTDTSGNVSTCEGEVIVVDDTLPIALCQNVTVELDANGNGTVTAQQVDNGSNDACGIGSLVLSQTSFDCTNIGNNQVTLTVTDNNGNQATCEATITVVDNVAPNVVTQDITIQLDASGNASITANDVDNGSSDACGIDTMSVSPNSFTCAEVGPNTVTLTVTDVNGNTNSGTAIVTVEDNVDPIAVCNDITVSLDATGNYVLSQNDIDTIGDGSSDACGIASLAVTPNSFTCDEIGDNTVTLTVTDNSGNTATCEATITVEGVIPTLSISEGPLPEFCQGAVVILTANSPEAISYLWTTGETAESIEVGGNGTYGVTVTSATNCTTYAEYTVTGFDAGALISAYTILGYEEVFLHGSNLVQSGAVGAMNNNGIVKLHQATNVVDFAQAPNIQLQQGSTVGTSIFQPANPTIPPFVFNTQSNNTSPNVTINNNQSQTLNGTVYGTITVRQNATVTFTQSNVYIDELKTFDGASIEFSGCANVFINDKFMLAQNGTINSAGNNVVMYVNEDVQIEKGSYVRARIHSNGNELLVKGANGNGNNAAQPTQMIGMFIANRVHGTTNVIWNADDVCNPCPVDTPVAPIVGGNIESRLNFDVVSWPNPSDTKFNLELKTSDLISKVTITVYDMSNKLVHQGTFNPNEEYTFGQDLQGGVYLVKINQAKNSKTIRLVKY